MTTISVVYHSGYGHTEKVAQAVGEGVKSANATLHMIKVGADGAILDTDWDHLNSSDAIIFGAPTYMGSVSGPFKMFMDATSKIWFTKGWKDKLAGGFTNSLSMSGDKLNSLFQMAILAAQHGMVWIPQAEANTSTSEPGKSGDVESVNRIGSYLGVMTQADNVAADQSPNQGDIKTAQLYGTRMVEAAKRWAA
ncbi:MAG TPA: flavodoxin family protein [Alphaproteobacteria bacterium]|nr:flavodoxin family protein [Alphaproteobacteria bacterium]HOO51177.1 flavodoxin family protein [Alphaproteobacteria bacterium]